MNNINDLPEELLLNILLNVDIDDIPNICKTDKTFNRLCNDKVIIERITKNIEDDIGVKGIPRAKTFKGIFDSVTYYLFPDLGEYVNPFDFIRTINDIKIMYEASTVYRNILRFDVIGDFTFFIN